MYQASFPGGRPATRMSWPMSIITSAIPNPRAIDNKLIDGEFLADAAQVDSHPGDRQANRSAAGAAPSPSRKLHSAARISDSLGMRGGSAFQSQIRSSGSAAASNTPRVRRCISVAKRQQPIGILIEFEPVAAAARIDLADDAFGKKPRIAGFECAIQSIAARRRSCATAAEMSTNAMFTGVLIARHVTR